MTRHLTKAVAPAPHSARFWSHVDRREPTECWPWTASKDRHGYGTACIQRKSYGAHRVAWALSNGREPDGFVCHSCDNPACCNPAHLWVGSHSDNMRDMVAKGRNCAPRHRSRGTHCRRGHPYPKGQTRSYCNVCRNIRVAKRKARA